MLIDCLCLQPMWTVGMSGHSPLIGLLNGIKSKAAISLNCDLRCKAIAALFFISYCSPI